MGQGGACAATGLRPTRLHGSTALRVNDECEAQVALGGEVPDARLAPLVFESLPSGRGEVGSAQGWTIRLEYGPREDGCLGMPGHVQVKLGRAPVLRQNTWLHVQQMLLLTTGRRAWLVLLGARRGQAIPLDDPSQEILWSLPGAGAANTEPGCD